jgi:hypothetical protein
LLGYSDLPESWQARLAHGQGAMSHSKPAANRELVRPPTSDEAVRAWRQQVMLLIGTADTRKQDVL